MGCGGSKSGRGKSNDKHNKCTGATSGNKVAQEPTVVKVVTHGAQTHCPGGHGLSAFPVSNLGWTCAICLKEQQIGATMFGCRPACKCDYDLCSKCAPQELQDASNQAAARVDTGDRDQHAAKANPQVRQPAAAQGYDGAAGPPLTGDTSPVNLKQPVRNFGVQPTGHDRRAPPQASDASVAQQAAASKIGANMRGKRERRQMEDKYQRERRGQGEDTHNPADFGLSPYKECGHEMPRVDDYLRFQVRDHTCRLALGQLGHAVVGSRFSSEREYALEAHTLLTRVTRDRDSIPPAVKVQCTKLHLFVDDASTSPTQNPNMSANANPDVNATSAGYAKRRMDDYLLGKFDALATPCRADFDRAFEQHPAPHQQPDHGKGGGKGARPANPVNDDCDGPFGFKGWFWIVHLAAPNIGESARADDFLDYSRNEDLAVTGASNPNICDDPNVGGNPHVIGGNPQCAWKARPDRPVRRLLEKLYLDHMEKLWRNSLVSMGRIGVRDAIFFPFGMGAFLRHLAKNDDRYSNPSVMRNLRYGVCLRLMDSIADLVVKRSVHEPAPARVHLCLVCVNAESIENHNCFVEAAAERKKTCPGLDKVLLIHRNVDSLSLAHNLAMEDKDLKVGLLNGANRKLIGNHWFQGGARFAIDENLHRRSASLVRVGLLCNMDTEARSREPNQLQGTIQWLGGSVMKVATGETVPVKQPTAAAGQGQAADKGVGQGQVGQGQAANKGTAGATQPAGPCKIGPAKPKGGGLCGLCAKRDSKPPGATPKKEAKKPQAKAKSNAGAPPPGGGTSPRQAWQS